MYGDEAKEQNNLPPKVHLKVRREHASYFLDENGNAREFRLLKSSTSWQKLEFNRFDTTDETKCDEEKSKGNSKYSIRWFRRIYF